MKKIMTLITMLALSVQVMAGAVPDKMELQAYSFGNAGQYYFKMGDTYGVCLNNVVYYYVGGGRTQTIGKSHNTITKEPYYCNITRYNEKEKSIFNDKVQEKARVTIHYTNELVSKL